MTTNKTPRPDKIVKTDAEWKAILSPEQYRIMRRHGTEMACSSPLDKSYGAGTYECAACGLPLFKAAAKFDSGTGWPSFFEALPGAVGTSTDTSYFMTRTEVHCARCDGHLGHVFPDGPPPSGARYCMNGVALKFIPDA